MYGLAEHLKQAGKITLSRSSNLFQHKGDSMRDKIRAAILTVYGIIFFLCWAVIGFIQEKFRR